jgi:hypothetical protein
MLLISLAHRSHGGFGGHAVAAEVLPETTDWGSPESNQSKKQGLTQNLGFNGIFEWDFSQQIWRFNGILNIKPGISRVVILFLSSRSRGSSKSPWDIYVYIHMNIDLIFMHCSKLPFCYECVWKWGIPTSPKWYLLNIRVRLILEGIITSILLLFSWGRWW